MTTFHNKKLVVEHVSAGYDNNIIIEDINFCLYEGELISIIGLSGVGKTTLFNVIAGLLKPDEGRVLLNNEDITNRSGYISYMLQKDLLLPFKTVSENIAMPLIIKGVKKKEAVAEVEKHLAEFGLEGRGSEYPDALSGGMRQRAALLRTYMFSGEAALLDEPFSALDSITKSAMHSWYLDIMEKIKLSTIFITHDIDEAIKLSDRIFILKGKPGRLSEPFEINLKKPRDIMSNEFIEVKRMILQKLNE